MVSPTFFRQPEMHYELHLTTDRLNNEQLPDFEKLCHKLGGKAVLIELPIGVHTQQPMLTLTLKSDSWQYVREFMAQLANQCREHGFPIVRQKAEIPANEAATFQAAYPHEKQGYFEWHGKVEFKNSNVLLQSIHHLAKKHGAHLSHNALKNQQNTRFLTLRHTGQYDDFMQKIRALLTDWQQDYYLPKSAPFVKHHYEYCVFDNKLTWDDGWAQPAHNTLNILEIYQEQYPDLSEYSLLQLCAQEAFLRRAAQLPQYPMMLKGSHLTRQYFANPAERVPQDLDFVLLGQYDSEEEVEAQLSAWAQAVSTQPCDDGVLFTAFAENAFWRNVDYAMSDDFPTTNTDLACQINGQHVDLEMDISFNLPIPLPPEPVRVATAWDTFTFERAVPLPLQIAWKLHQTLTRPHFKDLYDLGFLMQSISHDEQITQTFAALIDECEHDNIQRERIAHLFNGQIAALFQPLDKDQYWETFIHQYGMPSQVQSWAQLFEWYEHHRMGAGFSLAAFQAA